MSPISDLSGLKVVDISGWAPTSDGLAFVKNSCTGQRYKNYEIVYTHDIPNKNANDIGMKMLMD